VLSGPPIAQSGDEETFSVIIVHCENGDPTESVLANQSFPAATAATFTDVIPYPRSVQIVGLKAKAPPVGAGSVTGAAQREPPEERSQVWMASAPAWSRTAKYTAELPPSGSRESDRQSSSVVAHHRPRTPQRQPHNRLPAKRTSGVCFSITGTVRLQVGSFAVVRGEASMPAMGVGTALCTGARTAVAGSPRQAPKHRMGGCRSRVRHGCRR